MLAVTLFFIEAAIAVWAPPASFVRGSIGDLLVVILIHFSLRAMLPIGARSAALGTLAFAFAVEGLQAFDLAARLGFAPGSIGTVVIGHRFSVLDLLMYGIGCVIAYGADVGVLQKREESHPAREP